MSLKLSTKPLLLVLCLTLLLCFYLALTLGSYKIGPQQLFSILFQSSSLDLGIEQKIILQLRLPRAMCAFFVGAMLAVAGTLLQVLLRNPLADPYILGVSGGAATAALLAILLGAAGGVITGSAFAGACLSMLLVFGLSHGRGSWSSTRLLLTGVVIASGWGAAISLLLALSPERQLRGMLFWIMGDLSYATDFFPAAIVLSLCLMLCLYMARDLNLLARGELQASALGVSIKKTHRLIYFSASILTATAVALAGSVGFVGLIVPHVLRLLGQTDHRSLIPTAALLGGCLLIIADTIARTVVAPQQLPVGVITALIGVPVFLVLLQKTAAAQTH